MPHALVVEDHDSTRESLAELVEQGGFEISTAADLESARERLEEDWPDVILLDLKLPDGSGMALLDDLDSAPMPEVVLITGNATLDTAVEALRQGATDYLTKPVDTERLRAVLENVRRTRELKGQVASLRDELRALGRMGGLVGSSDAMQRVYDLVTKVAPTSANVLITGKSGTGKELVARTIHEMSRRAAGPFVAVNCGAVASNIMESELFGHEKGSFTGAEKRHVGYFERADGGTIFLDEITEMDPELQVKLLRVLEQGELTRVGGEESVEVDVRILAATNRDVDEAVEEGKLREDLYYRLNVFQIGLPPLAARGDDVVQLADHFLERLNDGQETDKGLTEEVYDRFREHDWPGNVRELQNVLESAFILADDEIRLEHLPPGLAGGESLGRPSGPTIRVAVGGTIAEAERRLIMAALEHFEGNKTRTAESLGVSLKTLYNRLKEYESQEDEADGQDEADGGDEDGE